MNGRIVFLLEEPSMKELLEQLLPRLFPGWETGVHFLCIQHGGKDDLRKSIPRKLRAWLQPLDRFVIVQDQDRADCRQAKARLMELCHQAGRQDALIRIVCQELEAWYFGDLESLAQEYSLPASRRKRISQGLRNPDIVDKPSHILEKNIPAFQKIAGARRMGRRLSPESNQSRSFIIFLHGIRRVAGEMGYSESSFDLPV